MADWWGLLWLRLEKKPDSFGMAKNIFFLKQFSAKASIICCDTLFLQRE
jgi:hypothetical protein